MMQQLARFWDSQRLIHVVGHKQSVGNAVSTHEHFCTSCCSTCMRIDLTSCCLFLLIVLPSREALRLLVRAARAEP